MMFLATLKAKLIAILGGALAVIGILFAVRQSGKTAARDEIKADTVDEIIETTKKVKEIDTNISNSTRDERRKRLRDNASDAD